MIRGADITIAQLRALLAVEEAQSYTRAAERLGVSQSGVSHAMQSLEERVGGALMVKTPQGVEPTALGELGFVRKVGSQATLYAGYAYHRSETAR